MSLDLYQDQDSLTSEPPGKTIAQYKIKSLQKEINNKLSGIYESLDVQGKGENPVCCHGGGAGQRTVVAGGGLSGGSLWGDRVLPAPVFHQVRGRRGARDDLTFRCR